VGVARQNADAPDRHAARRDVERAKRRGMQVSGRSVRVLARLTGRRRPSKTARRARK